MCHGLLWTFIFIPCFYSLEPSHSRGKHVTLTVFSFYVDSLPHIKWIQDRCFQHSSRLRGGHPLTSHFDWKCNHPSSLFLATLPVSLLMHTKGYFTKKPLRITFPVSAAAISPVSPSSRQGRIIPVSRRPAGCCRCKHGQNPEFNEHDVCICNINLHQQKAILEPLKRIN